jgi:hypothetical protein
MSFVKMKSWCVPLADPAHFHIRNRFPDAFVAMGNDFVGSAKWFRRQSRTPAACRGRTVCAGADQPAHTTAAEIPRAPAAFLDSGGLSELIVARDPGRKEPRTSAQVRARYLVRASILLGSGPIRHEDTRATQAILRRFQTVGTTK